MSITINGATNTLTAASGLTVAGNTAVTGTLSATGELDVNSANVGRANAAIPSEYAIRVTGLESGNYRELRFGVDDTAGYTWQQSFQQGVGATTHKWFNYTTEVMALSSTGLSVTGKVVVSGDNPSVSAENSAGYLALSGGTAVGSDGASLQLSGSTSADAGDSYANARVHYFRSMDGTTTYGNISSTGLSVTGTLSLNETVPAGITLNVFNASETGTTMGGNTLLRLASNASGADSTIQFTDSVSNNSYISGKSGHIYIQPDTAGISVADFSPTALTLGSGVNLVKDATTAILADTTDGYLIYGSSTTGTTGSTLVLFGEASAAPNEAHVRVNNTTKMTVATSAVTLAAGVNLVMAQSYIEGAEMTAPAAPAANGFRIFAEDNGAGKTRLMVQFATGAAQQIAIEP